MYEDVTLTIELYLPDASVGLRVTPHVDIYPTRVRGSLLESVHQLLSSKVHLLALPLVGAEKKREVCAEILYIR